MRDAPPNSIVSHFSEAQSAHLARISLRQLRWWAKSDFYRPAIDSRANAALPVSLYDFQDLVCLRVVGLLRNVHRISMQELRRVKMRLRHLGPELWRKTTLYVLRRKVVFENPETGSREDTSGQGVLSIPLRLVSGELEAEARKLSERDPATIGNIERKRGLANGRPVIAGTRILVDTVASCLDEGLDNASIIQSYPILTEKDIAAVYLFKETA